MQLYILRHAIAEERNALRWPGDVERPLTPAGKSKMEKAVRGMIRLGLEFDLVLTSPLARARQTARVVTKLMRPAPPSRTLRSLAPGGSTRDVLAGLPRGAGDKRVVLVGHEPGLSELATELLCGEKSSSRIDLKKGGLIRIDFEGRPAPGGGRLVFHLLPKQLRLMSGV